MPYQKYTEEQQAMFLLQLETLGYPDDDTAPARLASKPGTPNVKTLRRWWNLRNELPAGKLADNKKPDLIASLINLLGLHIDAAEQAVKGNEDLRAIDTGIGILVDKIQLLTGQATERHDVRQMTVTYVNDWRDNA